MDFPKAEIVATSIVLVGSFHPSLYTPAWFAHIGLIRDEEAKNANIEVILPEVIAERIGSIKIQAQPERFIASTLSPKDFELLRDLVVGAFKTLPHTPIRMLGINSDRHFAMSSEDAWNALGDRLAPKEPWGKIFQKSPGMRSLTMEGKREDQWIGFIRVKVEPSVRAKFGVYINVNDHYEIPEYKPETGCEAIIDTLTSAWNSSLKRADQIAEALIRS